MTSDAASSREYPRGRPDLRVPHSVPLLVGLVAAAAIAVWLQYRYIPAGTRYWGLFHNGIDLEVYRAGARHLYHDQPIYLGPVLAHFEYTYTPFSTIVFQPFIAFDHHTVLVVWSVLIGLALWWVVVAAFRSLGYHMDIWLIVMSALLVAVCTLMEPVRTTIWYGQINVFLMALVMWDLLRPDGSRLKGLGVGVAAGIKLTPAMFIVYLAATRRWRAVLVSVAALVATIVAGAAVTPRGSLRYWTHRIFESQLVGDPRTPSNQSINGALASIYNTSTPPQALWLVLALIGLVLGIAAAWVAHRRGEELLAVAVTGMTSSVVSPFSWGHHWVWFVPLLVYLLHRVLAAVRTRRWVSAAAWAAATSALYLTVFIWRFHIPHPVHIGRSRFAEFYGIGLFMVPRDSWLNWFCDQPYLWVFAATAVTVLVGWAPAVIREVRGASPAPAEGSDVGARR
ncbi:glycosyltransferase 87 family protein [Williamsia sterculiae]|uniref:Alpha-1,2-mannosyltransferase n=1 Tax=Williamsia sterculiae TaxID=1344003 RepID=A0A1N7F6R5_9NOCA|nr:glycosyltransferase 87 family protein [Williamsia sterculiae]SIR96010.1 alpha-1,2-mannosyltransferase [Williamsia sterculiae]